PGGAVYAFQNTAEIQYMSFTHRAQASRKDQGSSRRKHVSGCLDNRLCLYRASELTVQRHSDYGALGIGRSDHVEAVIGKSEQRSAMNDIVIVECLPFRREGAMHLTVLVDAMIEWSYMFVEIHVAQLLPSGKLAGCHIHR